MDIIYDVLQLGVNKFLFNYTVNSDTPVFILVFTNPWTAEEKTVTLNTPDGDDGEWIFNIEGVSTLFEDLGQGKIEFEDPGTWRVSVSESGNLIKNINLQVIEVIDVGKIKTDEQRITTEQILTANATPVQLVAAPGANKLIRPIKWTGFADFNSIAYETNLSIQILRGSFVIGALGNTLDFAVDEVLEMAFASNAARSPATDHINQAIFFTIQTGNPTLGNSPILSDFLYEEIDYANSNFD